MNLKRLFKFLLVNLCVLLPLISSAATTNIQNLKEKFFAEQKKGSCLSTLPLARSIYKADPEYVPALKTIVECTQSEQEMNSYASHTKEIFEQSKILSIVPKLLEMAQVKDLVPILNEVEVKKDKSITDYLMINEIYERLGRPEKQIENLKAAIDSAPGDPRPILILASKQFDSQQREQAEGLFKTYLEQGIPHPGRVYLMAYVLAILYPTAASLLCLLGIWVLASILAYRKIRAFSDWTEVKLKMPLFIAFVPPVLAFRFWQTGKALPLGALLLIGIVQIFLLFDPILSKIYRPIFSFIGKVFYSIVNGSLLARKLAKLSPGSRVLLSITTLIVLGTIAPTIESTDLKYGLIAFGSLILYDTIGSLMISFMRSRESLVTTLRWIGITATLPFLISYVVSNWNMLGAPILYGELPSTKAIESLFSYLMFWGVSLFLAMHLGKIMAEAFIHPIREIMTKVALIEKGQFQEKVKVYSKDEIGHLGHAVNRMGSGLEKREKIEKTFSKYVDKKIAERILDGVETEVRVEGQSVDAVVLFCDIRGFTSLSEKSTPEQVVNLLNQFFERMVRVVQSHGGVIDKFIGDNLMAVWGVPTADPDAESKAVRAALKMIEEVNKWNQELKIQGYSEVGIGIGLNTGPVVAGSIGSSDRLEYTVIGDTVNTAQRCESTAKRQQLVVTTAMYEKVKDFVVATQLEPVKAKGKAELQYWWHVTALADQRETSAA